MVESNAMRTWVDTERTARGHHAMSALGNGDLCVFAQGPEIIHAYGMPYSSPDLWQLHISHNASLPLQDQSERLLGTAVWRHHTLAGGTPAVSYQEYVASEQPVYVRSFVCLEPGVQWIYVPHPSASWRPCREENVWVLHAAKGERFMHYPCCFDHWCWVVALGSCSGEVRPDGRLALSLSPGEGAVAVVSHTDYPAGMVLVDTLLRDGVTPLEANTRRYWQSFTRRREHRMNLSADPPQQLDAVAVMMRCLRARDGGAIIGTLLPMAYIRDLYGASRGMLALGMIDEARDLLRFRFRKYQRFGDLHTAESIGSDCARHIHENDDVEGTAYTILQVRDYVQYTGDDSLITELWPMLEWCFRAQLPHLCAGMLPFSGDETYVAGGFYPRSGLLHGSADTTLAFVVSGDWLLDQAQRLGLWSHSLVQRYRELIECSRSAWRTRFFAGDRIWANDPEREALGVPPRFRHGVCEAGSGWFGWVERTPNGRYVRPDLVGTDLPAVQPTKVELHSVSLLPMYLGAGEMAESEVSAIVDRVWSARTASGYAPSVPGGTGFVGYDPGLLLYSLAALRDERAATAYQLMLDAADEVGYWNEYYDNSGHSGFCIRANMWSSGVCAAAAMKYLSEG